MSSLLLTYYGDDFTGSTDVMEALARSGVSAALFVEPPSPEQLARYPEVQAVGVAGISRALSPAAMRRELTPVFARLHALHAPLFHYKTCSTFDSSPQIGSIGCAIDIGQEIFRSPFVPMVIGAPVLGRYVTFGNLFARSGLDTEPYRLDRHPTMSHHPLTPMDESDLRLHLAKQTAKHTALFDVLQLDRERAAARRSFAALLESQPDIVLFDTLYESHLPVIGDLIWQQAQPERQLFAVGSSGLEYALTAHWREQGQLPAPPEFAAGAVEQIVVVSGSCSPVTERQIVWVLENGFEEIPLDTVRLLDETECAAEIERAVARAHQVLRAGRSPLLHTCRGPHDSRLEPTRARLQAMSGSSGRLLGAALGKVLRAVWQDTDLPRAAVTGGDTSGYVAREMGIEALEMAAPIAPGSPLCHIASPGHALHGREIVFKGGQVGKTDFFSSVLRGSA
ncbi:MAG: four-carbon acid sugar kinase family protein [Armatimonadota bacterium]|nr:four-carbon acid sugar kinase family protein [Armatimonadota bacterium]